LQILSISTYWNNLLSKYSEARNPLDLYRLYYPNFRLLTHGRRSLTVKMDAGVSPTDNGAALLAASDRAKQQLKLAATIKNLSYDLATGNLSLTIQNNTGHKLISGFPEGRRMFVNIKAYAAGCDDIALAGVPFPTGAERVEVSVFYQRTSREYVEFLRDEINGTASTLSEPTPSGEAHAYIIQTDPFFDGLKAWGDTIWDLWYHNHGLDGQGASVAGIVPFEMTQATWPPPTIDKLRPRPLEPSQIMRIIGYGFGDEQSDGVVHIGPKAFDSTSPNIKLWTDAKIKIRLPKYKCDWFKGKDFRRRPVWVTVGSVDSNKKNIKVMKPDDCP
jgi:hypothetical protein